MFTQESQHAGIVRDALIDIHEWAVLTDQVEEADAISATLDMIEDSDNAILNSEAASMAVEHFVHYAEWESGMNDAPSSHDNLIEIASLYIK